MTPFTLTPILKRARWGGRRLGDLLNKEIGSESDFQRVTRMVLSASKNDDCCGGGNTRDYQDISLTETLTENALIDSLREC